MIVLWWSFRLPHEESKWKLSLTSERKTCTYHKKKKMGFTARQHYFSHFELSQSRRWDLGGNNRANTVRITRLPKQWKKKKNGFNWSSCIPATRLVLVCTYKRRVSIVENVIYNSRRVVSVVDVVRWAAVCTLLDRIDAKCSSQDSIYLWKRWRMPIR